MRKLSALTFHSEKQTHATDNDRCLTFLSYIVQCSHLNLVYDMRAFFQFGILMMMPIFLEKDGHTRTSVACYV